MRGINGKNEARPKIANSAGTRVKLAIPMIRIDKLNGTPKRCTEPYWANSSTSRAITTVNPLMAIAPEEPLTAAASAFDFSFSSVNSCRKWEIKNKQ
ncbi:hypothetical protein D3C74_252760 [compost metagenome]